MTKKQNFPNPLIEKNFDQDSDIEKYLDEGGILAKIYLMMRSAPDVIEDAFNGAVEPIKDQKNIVLFNVKLYEVSRDVDFLGAIEIELLARDFRAFINVVMTYGPIRIDLIKPDEIFLSTDHVQNILADVSEMQKTLMVHVASALNENEKVLSPWDILPEETELDKSGEFDLNKISAVMFIEIQHEEKEILEKMVENKISKIRGDKNINLIEFLDYGIEKNSEIVGYEDEEEPKKEDVVIEKIEEEYDFYSDVMEIKFEVMSFRKLLKTVMKYQASGIEITSSSNITLSRKHANLLLGDVIKTGQMLSEQLQMLLSDPKRKAMYDAAVAESQESCRTCGR